MIKLTIKPSVENVVIEEWDGTLKEVIAVETGKETIIIYSDNVAHIVSNKHFMKLLNISEENTDEAYEIEKEIFRNYYDLVKDKNKYAKDYWDYQDKLEEEQILRKKYENHIIQQLVDSEIVAR